MWVEVKISLDSIQDFCTEILGSIYKGVYGICLYNIKYIYIYIYIYINIYTYMYIIWSSRLQ